MARGQWAGEGVEIRAWRTLHVEKPTDESIDMNTRDENLWRDMLEPNLENNHIIFFFDRSRAVRRDIFIFISDITAVAPQLKLGSQNHGP